MSAPKKKIPNALPGWYTYEKPHQIWAECASWYFQTASNRILIFTKKKLNYYTIVAHLTHSSQIAGSFKYPYHHLG